MEFEKDVAPTDAEIALADTPKLTVAPTVAHIEPEPINTNHSHQNEAMFSFESESTDQSKMDPTKSNNINHHATALLVSVGCTAVFVAAIASFLLLR